MVNKFILNFSLIIIKLYPVNPLIGGYPDSDKFISICRTFFLYIFARHYQIIAKFKTKLFKISSPETVLGESKISTSFPGLYIST